MTSRGERRAHAARTAVALDALVTAPPETAAAVRKAWTDRMPTALVDQLHAAEREAHDLMHQAGRRQGRPVKHGGWRAMPADMRLVALSTATAVSAGTHRQACPCDLRTPQPLAAAAWRPLTVTCLSHSHRLRVHPGSRVDRTCDRCGRLTDLADPAVGGIHAMTAQLGALIFMWGECVPCRKDRP